MQAGEAVLAKRALHRGLDPQEHAQGRVWARITADFATFDRQSGDKLGLLRNLDHVGDRHADIFGGHIFAAE